MTTVVTSGACSRRVTVVDIDRCPIIGGGMAGVTLGGGADMDCRFARSACSVVAGGACSRRTAVINVD